MQYPISRSASIHQSVLLGVFDLQSPYKPIFTTGLYRFKSCWFLFFAAERLPVAKCVAALIVLCTQRSNF